MDAIGSARVAIADDLGDAEESLLSVQVEPSVRDRAQPRQVHGSRIAKLAVISADTVAIVVAMTAAVWLRTSIAVSQQAMGPVAQIGLVSLPVWLCVFDRYKLYTAAAVTSRTAEIKRIIHAVAVAVACMGLISFLLGERVARGWLLLTFFFALITVTVERAAVRRIFRRIRAHGRMQRRVVIIGTNAEAAAIARMLGEDSALGYEVLGFLECGRKTRARTPEPVLGSCDDALDIVQDLGANGVIVATSAIEERAANRLARDLIEVGCHVELTSGLVDISADRLVARALGRRPVMYVEPVRRFGWRAAAKRTFDVALASTLLVFTAPLLLVSAIAIKFDSKGSVFFTQVRVGKDGKRFRVRKLRTMVADAEQLLEPLREQSEVDGPLFKMRNDPRLTRVGSFLRMTSIDELPQLWNVLRGEMSMVGPRPALPDEVSGWSRELSMRLRVKPGITGMWQVNGRSLASFDEYVRHDLYYVDNWSLLTDLAILAKTVPVVLFRRGAY